MNIKERFIKAKDKVTAKIKNKIGETVIESTKEKVADTFKHGPSDEMCEFLGSMVAGGLWGMGVTHTGKKAVSVPNADPYYHFTVPDKLRPGKFTNIDVSKKYSSDEVQTILNLYMNH